MTFDRVVVVSLDRRPDRRAAFEERRKATGWPAFFEWFPAVDGAAVPPPKAFTAGPGAWGCLLSHAAVLRAAGPGPLLVLEDDATWGADLADRLAAFLAAAPADWQLLMLGGEHVLSPGRVGPGVVRCRNTHRTHAYAARGPLAAELAAVWEAARGHIDHTSGPLHDRWRVYAPDPFLFGQAAGVSDVSGRVHPDRHWPTPAPGTPLVGWYQFRVGDRPGVQWGYFDPDQPAGGRHGPPPGMTWHAGPFERPARGTAKVTAPADRPPPTPEQVAAAREQIARRRAFDRHSRGPCAYKGDLLVKADGCRAGIRCTYECDHPDPDAQAGHPTCIPLDTWPAGGCPHWSDRVEPVTTPPPGH